MPLCMCVCEFPRVSACVWGVCGLPRWPSGKESACNAVDAGSIPGPGRPSGRGHGDPLQCSCLGKSLERGTWRARVYRVAQSRMQLKGLSTQHMWACACVCVCVCMRAWVNLCMRVVVCSWLCIRVHTCGERERKRFTLCRYSPDSFHLAAVCFSVD